MGALSTAEFEAASANRNVCSVSKLLLSPEERALLDTMMKRPDISTPAIIKVLAAHGYSVSESPVRRHRQRMCQCAQ